MNARARRGAVALAWLACVGAGGTEPAGLNVANFVDTGDSVAEMLDTNALAISTMLLGSLGDDVVSARSTSLQAPGNARSALSVRAPCPGGGAARTTMLDADASGDLSPGDRFGTSFEACVVGGAMVTGRSEFVVAAHRFEGQAEITELSFRFDDLGSADVRWSGLARAVLRTDLQRGSERYTVTYADLAVVQGPHRMRWNFSLDVVRPPIGDQLATVAGRMVIDGLRLTLHQDEPYAITGAGSPRSGQLTASDERGARLEVEAGRRRYAYRLFDAGNRGFTPDSVSQSKPYRTRAP